MRYNSRQPAFDDVAAPRRPAKPLVPLEGTRKLVACPSAPACTRQEKHTRREGDIVAHGGIRAVS